MMLQVKRKPRIASTHYLNNSIDINSKNYIAFTHNDYLGISRDPRLISSCIDTASKYGVSSRSSSVVTGYQSYVKDLEEEIADFLQYPQCIIFPCGYMANLSVAQSLLDRGDIVLQDKDNHASLIDSCILSRAKNIRYKHLDYKDLSSLCRANLNTSMIISESVFSMSGQVADIGIISDLKKMYCPQAKIFIDDTHGIGVSGDLGVSVPSSLADILSFGLGKGFGVQGGVVAGSKDDIDLIIEKGRSYRYSTAISPLLTSSIIESLKIIKEEKWRRDSLKEKVEYFKICARKHDLNLINSDTAIQMLEYKREDIGYTLYELLKSDGILVHPVVQPTVPAGISRLRIILNINHTQKEIKELIIRIKHYEKSIV